MGWGITIKDVYVSKVTKSEVPEKLEEAEECVKRIRETILMLIAGKTTKDTVDEMDAFRQEVSELLESYEEEVGMRNLLSIAKDNLTDVEDS